MQVMTKEVLLATALLVITSSVQALEFKKKDLVGAWIYVSTYSQFADGRKEQQFSDRPQGIFIILPNGHYSHIIMSDDLPKVGSGRIKDTTLDEAEKLAEGVLAHFGTYTVDEKGGTFTVKVNKSSFPNLDGMTQVRTITVLDKDNLSYVNDLSVAAPGATVVAVLKRLKP